MTVAVVGASQIATLAGPARARIGPEMGDVGLVDGGAMFVRDGLIESVGSRTDIERRTEADTVVVDALGGCVTPGFVDAHTHPVFASNRVDEYEMRSLGRTYAEIAKSGGGIMSTVRATRAATEDELFEASKRYVEWFLKGGTTTIEGKSGYGLNLETELRMLRVLRRIELETPLSVSPTLLAAHAVPDEFSNRSDAYVDRVVAEIVPAVAAENLATWADAFCELIAFDPTQTRRVLTAAKAAGMKIRVHVDQLADGGGASLAAELGAKTADHLEFTGETGIAAMAEAGVQPVLLPGSVYALGHERYADARAMIAAGLAVVVATDFNPGSSPTTSMPMVMSLACTHMRLSPAESLTAATINAAHSLDMGSDRGSLEPGKRADFVVWEHREYREIPYFFAASAIRAVYVSGRRVA